VHLDGEPTAESLAAIRNGNPNVISVELVEIQK
jgi:hypothetical protein